MPHAVYQIRYTDGKHMIKRVNCPITRRFSVHETRQIAILDVVWKTYLINFTFHMVIQLFLSLSLPFFLPSSHSLTLILSFSPSFTLPLFLSLAIGFKYINPVYSLFLWDIINIYTGFSSQMYSLFLHFHHQPIRCFNALDGVGNGEYISTWNIGRERWESIGFE